MITNTPVTPIIDDKSLWERIWVILAGLGVRGLELLQIGHIIGHRAFQDVSTFLGLDPDGSKLVSCLANDLLLVQDRLLEVGDLVACTLVDHVMEVGHGSLEQLVHLLLGEVGCLLRRLCRGSCLDMRLLV